jgi:predicted nucleic acid-binding protein
VVVIGSHSDQVWLIDKSALVGLGASPDSEAWRARIERGLVRISTLTVLESGFSARTGADVRATLTQPPIASMPVEYLTPLVEDRAVQVLAALADRVHHRAPSVADLLIAATAELAGLTVLHVDKDFELVADITHQPLERLVVDGS